MSAIWAGWRSDYVSDPKTGSDDHGCVLCRLVEATDDVEALVLERTDHTITVMNLYPYGSGHLMVAPKQHAASYEDLDDDVNVALARAQVRALQAIRAAYRPDGVNVGREPRSGRRRGRARASPRARAAALDRRHELHDDGRRGARAAREPARPATTS